MKTFAIQFLIITTLLSCGSRKLREEKEDTTPVANDTQKVHEEMTDDTVTKFIVDDYPVTTEMIEKHRKKQGDEIKHGNIHTSEEVWFSNPSSNETLIYALATDYFRMTSFCFLNNEIPDDLVDQIEFITDDFETPSLASKKKYLRNFISGADKLDERYFTTNKGFKLGDSKTRVLQILGNPDSIASANNIEKYLWEFVGDEWKDTSSTSKNNRVAEGSFGHQINMYFKREKLLAIIYHNDVP